VPRVRTVRYEAAGGVVVNGDRVLVLLRAYRDEVRLPKGHVDPGETAEQAAVREVIEESGYADVEVVTDLGEQTVEFDTAGWYGGVVHIVRLERYFLMRLTGDGLAGGEYQFTPEWFTWDEALTYLTFEPEREWVRRAREASRA